MNKEFWEAVLAELKRQDEAEERFLELINRPMPVNEDGTVTFKLIHAKDIKDD